MTNEWFLELNRVYSLLPNYDAAYGQLSRMYARLIDDATSESEVLLAGYFAKTDYILKEKSANTELRCMVNDMRLRLTKNKAAQKPENFLSDFQALCLFVALVYDTKVPKDISCKFPQKRIIEKHYLYKEDYFRVIVNSWDDEFIHCSSELDEADMLIRYSGDGQLYFAEHSYLKPLFKKGIMLNIIHPRETDDGVVLPEFIILEPDYLVDVSTIASCFESYAESPKVSLLRRLEPAVFTEHILMGNMAAELLDSMIHWQESQDDETEFTEKMLQSLYKQTAARFFRYNAMGIISVSPDREFHAQAWQQMINIYTALNKTLPEQLSRFDSSTLIVEPTFFSEMLGLQGRMDMLQSDMRILIEQKAGKAAFVPNSSNSDIPKHKEQHYIQMLLYMAIIRYNYRQQYDKNNKELHAYLLYSKYKRPLIGLGFAPELLSRAIKIRNLYVSQENDLCQGDIGHIISLTPDEFNDKNICGKFWLQYQRPRIENILTPFQEVSECERIYFERFYRFVALEHRLSKLGSQSKENSGFAGAWLSTIEEKIQCGNIILNLEIESLSSTNAIYMDKVILRYSGEAGNFRQGDIVILYPYAQDMTPDLRKTMVFRATILCLTTSDITLQLRTPQKDAGIFDNWTGMRWCLEHDFMESSYSGLYKGLYSFMCAPQQVRNLFLLKQRPKVVSGTVLRGDYGDFNILQQRVKNARELFLIIGPPGTGKTSFGMLNTLQEELLEENSKVLIVSFTNRSVDEICSKLYPVIDFIRIGGTASGQEIYTENYLSNIVSQCSTVSQLKDRVMNARVFVGTTSSVSAHLPLLSMNRFSLCIVDEASQILEPHLLPLISLCCQDGLPCISKFVMIGDHKQLPAVVQQRIKESRVTEPILNTIGLIDCRNSLFERLLSLYHHDPEVCLMLTRQGRMHPDIAHFPNVAFYGGRLQEVPLKHQLLNSPTARVRFIDVPSPENSPLDKVNTAEASVVVSEIMEVWQRYKESFKPMETVGVIVPYRNQISAIRSILAERLQVNEHPLLQITIDTVERYQGSQRKHIIYGFTVQKPYQLRFLTESTFEEDGQIIDRKLNVAMTRAQEYLVLIGSRDLLCRVPLYEKLIRFVTINEV